MPEKLLMISGRQLGACGIFRVTPFQSDIPLFRTAGLLSR
jgi:hypothetical protein